MTDDKWPMTRRVIADAERANGAGEYDLTDESEPELGNSLLREFAAEGLVEEVSQLRHPVPAGRPDRDKPS